MIKTFPKWNRKISAQQDASTRETPQQRDRFQLRDADAGGKIQTRKGGGNGGKEEEEEEEEEEEKEGQDRKGRDRNLGCPQQEGRYSLVGREGRKEKCVDENSTSESKSEGRKMNFDDGVDEEYEGRTLKAKTKNNAE